MLTQFASLLVSKRLWWKKKIVRRKHFFLLNWRPNSTVVNSILLKTTLTDYSSFLILATLLWQLTPLHSTLLHSTPCHATPRHVMPCHASPRHATTLLWQLTPLHSTLLHPMPHHAMPSHASPCHATTLLDSTRLDSTLLVATYYERPLLKRELCITSMNGTFKFLARWVSRCPVDAQFLKKFLKNAPNLWKFWEGRTCLLDAQFFPFLARIPVLHSALLFLLCSALLSPTLCTLICNLFYCTLIYSPLPSTPLPSLPPPYPTTVPSTP